MAYIKATKEYIKASTGSLSAKEVTDSIINNYGQSAENTLTLPTAAANMNFIAVISTSGAGAFHIKAGASDKIYLDGTALDDADKASCATPAVGNAIVFFSFKTGASAWDWIAESIQGTWTDGGA